MRFDEDRKDSVEISSVQYLRVVKLHRPHGHWIVRKFCIKDCHYQLVIAVNTQAQLYSPAVMSSFCICIHIYH